MTTGPGREIVTVRDDLTLMSEQRRELLRLQMEMETLAVEKLRGETELAEKLELEGRRSSLHPGEAACDLIGSSSSLFDVGSNVWLVPHSS